MLARVILPVLILLVGALAGGAAAVIRDTRAFEGRIYPGVAIAGTSVAGLTRAEAAAAAHTAAQAITSKPLALQIGSEDRTYTYADLGLRAYPDEAVAEAYAQVRTGPPWVRLIRRIELIGRPMDIPIRSTRDDRVSRALLTRMVEGFSATPEDAEVTVQSGRVVITRESREGRTLDVAATVQRIAAAMDAGADRAVADVEVVVPRFTTANARELSVPLATYTTHVGGVPNRVHNVGLAAAYIRGTIVGPGEVFSYNKTVGPRTGSRGFREAPVLIDNELVPGDGGGVCQVSSTLFNVALLSDLQILARTNHMRPVAYLPIGRDATVTYGALDLQFKNTTGHYLMIWSSLAGRWLTFTAYGTADPARAVSIIVSARETIAPPTYTVTKRDPLLEEGQTVTREALPGYRVRTYRIVRVGGEVVKRELVVSSYYNPVPRTIKIGIKKPTQTSASP
ncbi:MAG TPA: VanW family protein [bacterium]